MNITINEAKLTGLVLDKGSHENPIEGLCFVEAVAYTHDQPHTDDPDYVSQILTVLGRRLNDELADDTRQRLIPLIRVLPGTADDGHDGARSYMALDWLVRVWLPAWLELSPECQMAAARVRKLGPIVDVESAQRAGPVVRTARDQATAAKTTARDAARDAAKHPVDSAARNAARNAATATATAIRGATYSTWVTAWTAIWVPAGDLTWSEAELTATAAAGVSATAITETVAQDASWAAAWDVAWAAAAVTGDATGDTAWTAAWTATRTVLQPTVAALHLSAVELYRRMTVVGQS